MVAWNSYLNQQDENLKNENLKNENLKNEIINNENAEFTWLFILFFLGNNLIKKTLFTSFCLFF